MNRVLIVDDEQPVLDTVSHFVERMGFIPLTALSAMDALDIFHETKPGIILCDLNLGGEMDGVALCSRIRYEDKPTAMIAMSGYFSEYDKVYVMEVGFTDYLTKPINTDELYSALQCAFDRRTRWMKI